MASTESNFKMQIQAASVEEEYVLFIYPGGWLNLKIYIFLNIY